MKLVIQNMARVWGGNEKILVTLARGLMERGHDVTVSCPPGPVRDRARAAGIRVTRVRPRGALDVVSGLSFYAWLAKEKPDALLLTSWHSISWASFAGRAAGVRRIVLRQGIMRRAPSRGTRAYALRNRIDDVITNAPEIKQMWLESVPSFPSTRVHVVLNAVAPASAQRPVHRAKLRQELGVTDDVVLIGAAGILTKRKNVELLFEAVARADMSRTMIVIIGDGPHRQELESIAARLGIASTVRFLGHRANAAEVIGGLDVFVLSSRNEGMANVMLEAMAGGAAVVAADISGVRTAIGETSERPPAGWIFPADDVSALTTILNDVVVAIRAGSEEARARVSEAQWRIENWFTLERMLSESERILFG